jgi:hypothetical protein
LKMFPQRLEFAHDAFLFNLQIHLKL